MAQSAHTPAAASALRDTPATQSVERPRGRQDRSLMFFFALVTVTTFLATMLLVEDNLFVLGWKSLLSLLPNGNTDVHFATPVFVAVWNAVA